MFDGHISYKSVAYSITKGFIDENSAKFYLYWKDKINNIDITNLSIVDKVFVLMCQQKHTGGVKYELEETYNIKINEYDVKDILLQCQCFDIEITVMAKSFYRYILYPGNFVAILEEQIYHIMQYKNIDLPYTFKLSK